MAKAGNNYSTSFVAAASPDDVTQTVLAGIHGCSNYSMNMAGANTVMLTRRYCPTWVIVVAVFLFPIGLLALLYKETETLTISVAKVENGSRVMVSGTANPEVASRLNGIVNALNTHLTSANVLS